MYLNYQNYQKLIYYYYFQHNKSAFFSSTLISYLIFNLYEISYPIKIKHIVTNTRSNILVFSSLIVLCSIKLISSTVNCHICINSEACCYGVNLIYYYDFNGYEIWNMDSKGIPNLKPYADLNYISRILISEYPMSTANISSERSGGLRQRK